MENDLLGQCWNDTGHCIATIGGPRVTAIHRLAKEVKRDSSCWGEKDQTFPQRLQVGHEVVLEACPVQLHLLYQHDVLGSCHCEYRACRELHITSISECHTFPQADSYAIFTMQVKGLDSKGYNQLGMLVRVRRFARVTILSSATPAC
jgi:hypothetical protein